MNTDSSTGPAESPTLRVLVAEDETLIRMDLVETLQELGYDVCGAAANGQQAVDLALTTSPDVVLMDISMPIRDGISAAEQIIERGVAPVVMLSAFSESDLIARAATAGVFGYLVKPLRTVELAPAFAVARQKWAAFGDLNSELERFRSKAVASEVVDRGKRLLMDQGLTEEQAFTFLRKMAMDTRQTIAEAAARLLGSAHDAGFEGM